MCVCVCVCVCVCDSGDSVCVCVCANEQGNGIGGYERRRNKEENNKCNIQNNILVIPSFIIFFFP